MKKRSRLFLPIIASSLLLSFGLVACGGGGGGGKTSATSAKLEKINVTAADNKTSLILGDTVQLTASVGEVTWVSSKTDVASVDTNGLVTSLAVGSTTITASKDGYRDGTITIKVDLETIKVTATETSVVKGSTINLTASKDGVTWTSSDESIAKVANGVVTGVSFGTVTITASKQGFNSGSVSISVTRPAPTKVLHMEDAEHFAADGTWASSNNPDVSPVYNKSNASDGTCCAHFGGGDIETIRFTSSKAVKAEIVLKVGYYYAVENFTTVYEVKFNGTAVTFPDGQSYTPEDTTNYTYQGVSFGELDLIADTNVLEIKMKEDASRIPYMDDLEIYAAEAVTINIVEPPQKDPVVINQESITVVEGKTSQITSSMTGLSFKSASTSVATVDENGVVTGVKAGSTTISVSKDGYQTIRVPVTVTEAEGVIVVQVESGTSVDNTVTFKTSNNLESGNLMVDAWPTGAILTLSVQNSGAAGKFTLYMNARAHGGYQSSYTDDLATCIELKVNGTKLAMTEKVLGGAFALYTLGEVDLNAGANTMTIECLTDAPTIDLFRFIPKA